MTRLKFVVLIAAGVMAPLGLWWVTSAQSRSLFYPPMATVLAGLWDYWLAGPGRGHLLSSLAHLALGLTLGIVGGVVLGLVMGQARRVRVALTAPLDFVRAIPATALIPFAMVIFGLGTPMKVFIIAVGTLFPVLLNVTDGVRAIPQETLDTARSFGLAGWTRQRQVIVPAMAPRALAGIRIAVPLSLVLVVTSEMTGSSTGIGYVLVTAQNSFNQASVWGAIVLLGVLGVGLNALFLLIERRLIAWHHASHGNGEQ